MSDDLSGLARPGQRTTEDVSGRPANIAEPLENWTLLLVRRSAEVVALGLLYPLLIGPPILIAYAPAVARAAVRTVGRWLDEDDWDRPTPWLQVAAALIAALALTAIPDAWMRWWPFGWQAHRASWWWLKMHPALLLLRALPVVASWAAWRETWYLDQRQRQEIIMPTQSGVAFDTHPPHAAQVPGIYNPYHDPAAPVIVEEQPIKTALIRATRKPRRDVLKAPSGDEIAKDKLLAMVGAQDPADPVGFALRTWTSDPHRWSRSEWDAAMALLTRLGVITAPQSGQTTTLLMSVEDALDAVVRLR